jgi:UDP-glucose:(heptosyl)LPS alpha-1,3-glucosyltransferase
MIVGIAHLEYSRTGGIERASAELADRVARRGHEVHFHAARWTAGTQTPIVFHRVPVIPQPHSAELASFRYFAPLQLRLEHYDITHSHGRVTGCDIVTAHSCHLAGMRRRGKHPVSGLQPNRGITDRLLLGLETTNFRKRRYRKVIAVAEGVRRELLECYGVPDEDVVVIPNGVDLAVFSPDRRRARRDESRRSLGLTEDEAAILFVGNEFERKGLKFALGALALAKPSRQKLIVAGKEDPEPYRGYAEHLGISANVLFAGVSSDIPSLLAAADIFLLPTSYEAFSLALLEAAATGLPIVTTRVNGAVELLQDQTSTIFVNQDSQEIAKAVRLLLESPELRARFGHESRKAALQYSWEVIAEKTVTVYESVMAQKRKEIRT